MQTKANPDEPLGIAVIGAGGGVGRGSHLPAIALLPELRLVAVCDVNEAAARAAAAEYGADAYTDDTQLLARDDVDIVVIASPDYCHAEQTIAAARMGKHVLCEKPIALSMDEAKAMRAAIVAAGVKFMAAQCLRWHPEGQALQRSILAGEIGRPVWGYYLRKGRHYPYPADSFYRTAASGGQFVHNGMHYVDLICWLMGSLPVFVYALTQRHFVSEDVLDSDNYVAAHLRLESGASAIVEMNQLLVGADRFPAETRISVVGTEGTVESGGLPAAPLTVFSSDGLERLRSSPTGVQSPFTGELRHFAQCVRDDRAPDISMDWSIRILEACLGAVQSGRTGELVHLGGRA